nr:hypothetical protein [uncultured bacterium]
MIHLCFTVVELDLSEIDFTRTPQSQADGNLNIINLLNLLAVSDIYKILFIKVRLIKLHLKFSFLLK